jgi:signal transduction histidine kinase
LARGESRLETVGVENAYVDVLEESLAASAELAGLTTVADVADAALRLALTLSSSTVAFLALSDENGESKRVFSKAVGLASPPVGEEIDNMFTTAPTVVPAKGVRTSCTQSLVAAGRVLGIFGVSSLSGYTAAQERSFALFANHVAAAIAVAQLHDRRQEMVDTLVNLRADLDRSEKQRLVEHERARSAERVEHAHEAAVDALLAVSRHARSGHGLTDFYRRLTRSIAELVGAEKVLFWQLDDDNVLTALKGAHAIDDQFLARLYPAPCAIDRDDLASRVVFHDLMFRATSGTGDGEFQYVLDVLGVRDAMAVPWRAGDERLGLVAAYNSQRTDGFTREDAWVLQKAGLAAGLVWQLRYAETDLKKTVERLQRVDAARQMLLRNVSTAVDTARKRFAGDLHDDALQKLTAAELQLQRLHDPNGEAAPHLAEAQDLLAQTEEALRRLLFEVRPPALEVPGGFEETLRERVRMLKSVTGAEVELLLELPENLSFEFRSMLFRQVTEAMTNIEKHAAATQVRVSLTPRDGGIHGLLEDNGRGFVVAERERLPGHLGLLALHERALLAGGWNKVTSEPGMGAKVEFWLPVSEAKV